MSVYFMADVVSDSYNTYPTDSLKISESKDEISFQLTGLDVRKVSISKEDFIAIAKTIIAGNSG